MTNYYIEKDSKIVLFDTDKTKLENTLKFMPQYRGLPILETQRPIIDYQFADTEQYINKELSLAKQAKLNEATDKAYSFENKDALITVSATNMMSRSSETYHIEATLTNNIKLSAYAQALDESETLPWNTKENVNVLLNKAACTTLTELMSQLNAKLWTVDFPTFLAQIEAAQTVEDVEAIEIVYKNPEEIIDVNVSTEKEEVSDENTPDNDIPEVQEDSDIQEDTAGETE